MYQYLFPFGELKKKSTAYGLKGRRGSLTFLDSTIYPEQCHPGFWHKRARMLQDEEKGRYVGTYRAHARCGKEVALVVKGVKRVEIIEIKSGQVVEEHIPTPAAVEARRLEDMRSKGIPVPRPIAYFSAGSEQYVYMEKVEGQNPLEALAGAEREQVLAADARLLAQLCNHRYKHIRFFDKEFDDKLWDGQRLNLIDVDETVYLPKDGYRSHVLKNHEQEYYDSWLLDVLWSYQYYGIIQSSEMLSYAQEVLRMRGHDSARAEGLLATLTPDRTTEESHFSMMADSD